MLEGAVCALLVLAIGMALLHFNFRLGKHLERASYDWCFDLSCFTGPDIQDMGVVIIYLDEKSHTDLRQPLNAPWNRSLHAQLVDRLTADGAKAVVFDILFTDPGPDTPAGKRADESFSRAILANGKVILAADYAPAHHSTSASQVAITRTLTLPYEPFQKVAAGWGLAQLTPDEDFIIREHYHGPYDQEYPGLAWATARSLNLETTRDPAQRLKERWIHYYGRPESIPHLGYSQVPDMPPGFFRDKVVFIGARPTAGFFIERRDELRSPYFTWRENFLFMPAVEVQATVFLNLLRGDWLNRLSPVGESALLLFVAVVCGVGLSRLRPLVAAGLALLGMMVTTLLAFYLFDRHHLWFPWMIVALGQIPVALGWTVLVRSIEWYVQKRKMQQEQHQAELQIREQAALLDKAQDAIAVRDLEGRLLFWNKGAERVYGWATAEVLGKNEEELLYQGAPPQVAEARQCALERGEWKGELHQLNKDQKPVIVESRWSLVRDDAGGPKSILIINTDVTEQKKLEAQFLRTQRMESIGTLAGGIAHDLNNMLTPIIMGVQILEMKPQDPHSQKMLTTIGTSAKRGADLVKQVLTFARGHEGERAVLQLNHLIKEMDKIMRETFPKSIRVCTRIPTELSPVNGDATQLHQVLLNLCVNARDAMPEGGELTVEAENCALTTAEAKGLWEAKPGDYVALKVTDTGTGIPSGIIDNVFEPFFTTKEVGKGTGLGLSTVLSIVKGHGGFLDLKTEVGKGTTFTVYLPAALMAPAAATEKTSRDALQGRGELVMVVDDEPAIRDTAQAVLQRHGYEVVTAAQGTEALALGSRNLDRLGVAVVDMIMPGLDGPATIHALKKLRPHLPCVAISGLLEGDKLKARLGPLEVAFLPKPFTADKLLRTVREALRRVPRPVRHRTGPSRNQP